MATAPATDVKGQDAYTAAQAQQDAAAHHATRSFKIWRGEAGKGEFVEYKQDVVEGMVVLDAVHEIQATQANDLAVRWNCKAGKCGSCSAEINGMPKLMCMTRLADLEADKPVTVEPMRAFPHVRDLVTDVSWNYRVKTQIQKFQPRAPDAADGTWRMQQEDIDRVQEFRKCIEMLLVSGRLPRLARPPQARRIHWAALSRVRGRARDASARHGRSGSGAQASARYRLLQHHQVLHQGVPGAHHDHGQRHHPTQRASGR